VGPSRARARGRSFSFLSQRRRRVLARPPDALPLSGACLALWGASGRCATRSSRAPPLEEHTSAAPAHLSPPSRRHRPGRGGGQALRGARRAAGLSSRRQRARVDVDPPLAAEPRHQNSHLLPPAPANSATSESPHAMKSFGAAAPRARRAAAPRGPARPCRASPSLAQLTSRGPVPPATTAPALAALPQLSSQAARAAAAAPLWGRRHHPAAAA